MSDGMEGIETEAKTYPGGWVHDLDSHVVERNASAAQATVAPVVRC
jgi:hypothetical protein